MSEYTPEPWAYSGYCEMDMCHHIGTIGNNQETGINLGDGKCIAKLTADSCGETPEESSANARRIVACVNACAGIETERLESGSPEWWGRYVRDDRPAMEREITRLRAERGKLCRAAGIAYEVFIQESDNVPLAKRAVLPNGAIKILRAALAEKGE